MCAATGAVAERCLWRLSAVCCCCINVRAGNCDREDVGEIRARMVMKRGAARLCITARHPDQM